MKKVYLFQANKAILGILFKNHLFSAPIRIHQNLSGAPISPVILIMRHIRISTTYSEPHIEPGYGVLT